MTNEVIWTKIVLERFIEQANLSEDEEIVMRTRAAGWSRTKQAMELNLSVSNTTAQTQKILDALSQNKIEALQAQVTQLQMQNAMCGVVRYPNATTYCSGSNPFGNCGCGVAI